MSELTKPQTSGIEHHNENLEDVIDNLQVAVNSGFINPQLAPYNYKASDTLEQRTASLVAAFEDANTKRATIVIDSLYYVKSLTFTNHRDYTIVGSGGIICVEDADHVLGFKNCTGLQGGFGIVLSTTATVQIGLKVWAEGGVPRPDGGTDLYTCSLHRFKFSVTNTVCGVQYGDMAAPTNLISECTLSDGYTFNVSVGVRIIGANAVIEVNNYQAIAHGSHLANNIVYEIVGGSMHINGGEAQQTVFTSGTIVAIYPIHSPENAAQGIGNYYGHCYMNGVSMESAGRWLAAYNRDGVTNIVPGSGAFVLSNTSGYASFLLSDLLQGDNTFNGKVVINETNSFHRITDVPLTNYVSGMGTGCKVSLSDAAFDSHFRRGFQLFRPNQQIPMFDMRTVFTATNLGGATINNGAEPSLGFTSKQASGDNVFYFNTYNSGVLTVPYGGWKDVHLNINFMLTAKPAGSVLMSVVKNGVTVLAQVSVSDKYFNATLPIGDLAESDTIVLKVLNQSGGSIAFTTTDTDYLKVRARTNN